MPTTLTGTSLLTQRPKAFLPKANTNGISCSRAMAITLYKASSKPPAKQKTVGGSKVLHLRKFNEKNNGTENSKKKKKLLQQQTAASKPFL